MPTITTDASQGNLFTITIGGNRTIADPTNAVDGQKITYRIKQDGNGGRTITWGATFRFVGGTPPTISATAHATTYVGFIYNSADSTWDCVAERGGF